jgi:ParB/RepB/Spo0J family partition protein
MTEVPKKLLSLIEPWALNSRFDPSRESLESLAASIEKKGVIQPIVTRPHPDTNRRQEGWVQIVIGERRWAASIQAGKETIPCIVRSLTVQDALDLMATENAEREDLHPFEQCLMFQTMIEAGMEPEHIADRMGVGLATVYRRLKLDDLIDPIKEGVADVGSHWNRWQVSALECVAKYPENVQTKIAQTWNQLNTVNPRMREDIPTDVIPTSLQIDGWVKTELRHHLDAAPFDITDEDLLPSACACPICPKQSGHQPELFGGVEVTAFPDCMDPGCWEDKTLAHVKLRIKEEKGKGVTVEAVMHGKGVLRHKAKGLKGFDETYDSYGKKEVKTPTKHSQPVMIQSGARAGTLVHIEAEYRDRGGNGAKPKKKAPGELTPLKDRRKRHEKRRQLRMLGQYREMLMNFAQDPRTYFNGALGSIKEIIVAFIMGVDHGRDRPWDHHARLMMAFGTIERRDSRYIPGDPFKIFESLTPDAEHYRPLFQASLARIFAGRVDCDGLDQVKDAMKELHKQEGLLGEQMTKALSTLYSEVCAELPEPASWKNMNADGSVKTAATKAIEGVKSPREKKKAKKKKKSKPPRKKVAK